MCHHTLGASPHFGNVFIDRLVFSLSLAFWFFPCNTDILMLVSYSVYSNASFLSRPRSPYFDLLSSFPLSSPLPCYLLLSFRCGGYGSMLLLLFRSCSSLFLEKKKTGVSFLRACQSPERGPIRDALLSGSHLHELRVAAEGLNPYRGVVGLCCDFGDGLCVRGTLLAGNQRVELGKGKDDGRGMRGWIG